MDFRNRFSNVTNTTDAREQNAPVVNISQSSAPAMEASTETARTPSPDRRALVPAPATPRTLADMGLNVVFMRDILLKTMFRTNIETSTELAKVLGISNPICIELVDISRGQGLIETLGSASAGDATELRYQLTDGGRKRATVALEQSSYFGTLPVPMDQFKAQVAKQSVSDIAVTRTRLENAMKGMIIDKKMVDEVGPAINSGKSMIFYGPPGNGKSTLARCIRDAIGDKIYIPQFLEYNGQVISMYDPVIHESAEEVQNDPRVLRINNANFDARYLFCKRPAVVTGGELKLDMLEMTYNDVSKTYQAPLQLKSIGGLFIVDDLGRQSEPPQALINRWITPMEEGEDVLSMNSGEKFAVPFDTLVIFSTNFHPTELFDGAALRRINSKIMIDGPTRDQMLQIYVAEARRRGLDFPEDVAIHLFTEKYPTVDNTYAAFQPGFLFGQIQNICAFEDLNPVVTKALMDRAWDNLFVADSEFSH